ncbi:hypothetical protein GGD83_004364 [Rhodoblastus sphagnicola]|nr:hypothetical protein [Rhodoblastus sphagnicola]
MAKSPFGRGLKGDQRDIGVTLIALHTIVDLLDGIA